MLSDKSTARPFYELFNDLPADGWLTLPEAQLLIETARCTEGPILEVGTYHGRSACLLASLGRPLYCVDPFQNFSDTDPSGTVALHSLQRNLQARGLSDLVTVFVVKIEEWKPRPVGMAYLDGDHTPEGTRAQILKALECRPRAIAIHDVDDKGDGRLVRNVAVEMLGRYAARAGRLAVWHPL